MVCAAGIDAAIGQQARRQPHHHRYLELSLRRNLVRQAVQVQVVLAQLQVDPAHQSVQKHFIQVRQVRGRLAAQMGWRIDDGQAESGLVTVYFE